MIKKIFRYVVILLLLLLGLCAIGLLFLFFVPNSSIFGITYIGKKTEFVSQSYDLSKVTTVELNSVGYDVNIVTHNEDSKISAHVLSNSFGYVLKKNSKAKLTYKLYNSKLTFTLTEPHGFATKNSSYIEIRLPKMEDAQSVNLILNNSSASTTLKCDKSNISTLTYKTNSGDLNLNSGAILGSINLTLNKANCKINGGIQLKNNNVTLSQTSGGLSTANGKVLGNITHLGNSTGSVNVDNCANYTANLGTAGGKISLGTVNGDVNITSSDTHVSINEAVGTINLNLTGSGSATIKKMPAGDNSNASTIKTASGKINVDTSQKFLMLRSASGSINVENMFAEANVVTDSGNVTIKYNKDAEHFNPDSSTPPYPRKATIKSKSGNVVVTGVENINLTITGKGTAKIFMNEVTGKNLISAATGTVNVTTPSNFNLGEENRNKYYLNANASNGGTVYINVSGYNKTTTAISSWSNVVGYKDPKPSPEEVDNWLTITSTSGNISVVNPNLY